MVPTAKKSYPEQSWVIAKIDYIFFILKVKCESYARTCASRAYYLSPESRRSTPIFSVFAGHIFILISKG